MSDQPSANPCCIATQRQVDQLKSALALALGAVPADGTVCAECGGDGTAMCHAVTSIPGVFNRDAFIRQVVETTPWCEHAECDARGTCHVHKLDVEKALDAVISNQAQITSNEATKQERATLEALRAQVAALTKERDAAEENFTNAAAMCAGLHAAAVGEVRDPDLGVIEDVKEVRRRMLAAENELVVARAALSEARAALELVRADRDRQWSRAEASESARDELAGALVGLIDWGARGHNPRDLKAWEHAAAVLSRLAPVERTQGEKEGT